MNENTSATSVNPTNDPQNLDPITKEAGSHPVGTGIGAAAAGVLGATAGTVVAGPVGTVIGAAVGAVVGGLSGSSMAEGVFPTQDGSAEAKKAREDDADEDAHLFP